MKPAISNHVGLIRLHQNKSELSAVYRAGVLCTAASKRYQIHLSAWKESTPAVMAVHSLCVCVCVRTSCQGQEHFVGRVSYCSTSSAGFLIASSPLPHRLLAKVHPSCHTYVSHLYAPTDDHFLRRASKRVSSHTLGHTVIYVMSQKKVLFVVDCNSGVGLLLMERRWEVWDRKERKKKAWRVEWQVISTSTADQVHCVEMHCMSKTHLSLSQLLFSFPISSQIFWFLRHITTSIVKSFFPVLFTFQTYLFFSPCSSLNWCFL